MFRLAQINFHSILKMHFQLLLTIRTPHITHNLRRVEKTYIIIYFFCRSGVFSQRNSRGFIGISLFMQRPRTDIPPIVQFERYSIFVFIAGYKIAQNQHERESYFTKTFKN